MLELTALIITGTVSLASLGTLSWLTHRLLRDRRELESELLDRIQSPSAAEYAQRKWNDAKLTESQAALGPSQEPSLFDLRPWEHDPELASCDVLIDQAAQEVQIIDEEQELTRHPLHDFLARYAK
jgi:hypothetical protein